VSHLDTRGEIQSGGPFVRGLFPLRRFPRQTFAIVVDVQDPMTGFAPSGSTVFGDTYPRSQACDETTDDEVGGVGTTGGGSEIGEAHGRVLGAVAVVGAVPGVARVGLGGGGLGGGGDGYGGGVDGGLELLSELAGG